MSSRSFFISFIFVTLFAVGFCNTTDPDFFWHIKTGKLILESGFPHGDPFSFTKLGSYWHLHEWLSEVLMYLLYVNFPHWVLSALFSFFIFLAFLFVYKRCEEKPYIACLATFMTAYVSGVSWGVRPQVFNMLGASVFIYILEKVRRGEYGLKSFLILFPVLILWINLHAGAVLGCLLIIFYVGLNFLFPYAKKDRINLNISIGLILLSVVCLLISPNGIAALFYPFETLTSPAMMAYIDEWHSPDSHTDGGAAFFILVLCTLLLSLISTRKPGLSEGILILGSLAQAFMSYRNIPFFCICVAPYLSSAIGDLFGRVGVLSSLVRPKPIYEPLKVKLLFLVCFLSFFSYAMSEMVKTARKEGEDIKTNFPLEAMAKLKELNPKRVFNLYSWGGYLIWNDIPVFIDGRADMYGDEFFNKYADIAKIKKNGYEILESFKVDYVLYPTDSSLVLFLKATGQYEQVYEDKVGTILKRKGS